MIHAFLLVSVTGVTKSMMNAIDRTFDFPSKVLAMRSYRQQLLASNIANADTPNYKARDIDFASALRKAQFAVGGVDMVRTAVGHLDGKSSAVGGVRPMYRTAVQPSIDGNTVDTNIEQAQFSENALQYMSTLQFINGKIQSTMSVLKGQ